MLKFADRDTALVTYNDIDKYIYVKILTNKRSLKDIESTAQKVSALQIETNAIKVFYDHSDFPWEMDYLSEFELAKNFSKLLPFYDNTKIAFLLGQYYNEKYWRLMQELINKHSKIIIQYFADKESALHWLNIK